ncbi:MAG: 50S ribosomal protein L6 [Deltaproteobacteria bacterium]|jgi:large subunit ribosomal protein L6|nr:50S ribosomal protein L6 [Deltaproteobacteria bacterium]
MSRIGKLPIEVPKGVKVEIAGNLIKVEGPKGKLQRQVRPEVTCQVDNNVIVLVRKDDTKESRAFHGMERALVNNMVKGVATGFEKILDVIGVGYRVDVKGDVVDLTLGLSHPVEYKLPAGVKGTALKEGKESALKLEGVDKQLVNETAAQIKRFRPPECYKGKGIRYRGEVIKLKAGKTGKK